MEEEGGVMTESATIASANAANNDKKNAAGWELTSFHIFSTSFSAFDTAIPKETTAIYTSQDEKIEAFRRLLEEVVRKLNSTTE